MAKSGVRVGYAPLACVGDSKLKQPNGINQCVVEVRWGQKHVLAQQIVPNAI